MAASSNSIILSTGDKCYGLAEERHDFFTKLRFPKVLSDELTVDFVNDILRDFNIINYQLNLVPKRLMKADGLKRKLAPLLLTMGSEKSSILRFNDFCITHFEIGRHYSPGSLKELDYFIGVNEDDEPFQLDPYIKTRCKAGIIWTIKQGKQIVFTLNKLDFKEIFKKTGCAPEESSSESASSSDDEAVRPLKKFKDVTYPKRSYGNSYTASEMRFMYRLFNSRILTEEQKKLIIFNQKDDVLDDYVEVDEPWITDPSIIGSYKPSNINRSWIHLNKE